MSENEEIYTAGKNFTLPPALTALTNSTSETRNHSILMSNMVLRDASASKNYPVYAA